MLPPANRMRRAADFTAAVRQGRRCGRRTLVLHQHRAAADPAGAVGRPDRATDAPLVGLIVSRAVGGAVVRHRVSRRLRAQLAARLPVLPAGSCTVIRALPPAATAASAELAADLDGALARIGAYR